MPSLDPPNFGAWACCSITHAHPWSSKFWSLRHVVYLTHANLDPPKFWSLRWVLYVTHAQPRSSKFGVWACCIIYTCKTLVLQLSELRGHVVCITHAQPWSSKFWSLGMSYIYTCPTSVLQISELRACCIFYLYMPNSKLWNLEHVMNFTHARPWSSNFWSLRHVVNVTHAQPWSSKSGAWACCIFYTCPTLFLQISGIEACRTF